VCCSMLCVVVYCSDKYCEFNCVFMYCSALQRVAVCSSVLQNVAVRCSDRYCAVNCVFMICLYVDLEFIIYIVDIIICHTLTHTHTQIRIKHQKSLLQNVVSFTGLIYKRDLNF